MDDKLKDIIDGFNVEETEKLLQCEEGMIMGQEMDPKTAERIKAAVYEKSGFVYKHKISKTKLSDIFNTPGKLRTFLVCCAMTLLEGIAIAFMAFMSWLDIFLGRSGINISLYGIVPLVLAMAAIAIILMIIYRCMYQLDEKGFSIKRILPGNKQALLYFTYFVVSLSIKALLLVLYVVFFLYPMYSSLMFFMILPCVFVVFVLSDLILLPFNNWIVNRQPLRFSLSMKEMGIEALKYVLVFGFGFGIAIVFSINSIIEIAGVSYNPPTFAVSFIILFVVNFSAVWVVQIRKRAYSKDVDCNAKKALDEPLEEVLAAEDKEVCHKPYKSPAKDIKWLRQRGVVFAVLSMTFIYGLGLFLTYAGVLMSTDRKPEITAFKNHEQYQSFFRSGQLPFEVKGAYRAI